MIGTFRPTEIGSFRPTQNGRFRPTLTMARSGIDLILRLMPVQQFINSWKQMIRLSLKVQRKHFSYDLLARGILCDACRRWLAKL